MAIRNSVKVGQIVLIPAKVKAGMFPTERYFYWEIAPGNNISGYVVGDQVQNDRVRAVIVNLTRDNAVLALPGELTRNNLVRVPIAFAREHAER
ncbi:MAG TPA: hypothetical protein VL523_20485 [Terriglobia bacterium]|nr:hypothetical protein [Terriglobia bacterium]